MIKTFADRDTERLFERQRVKRFGPDVQRVGLRKLRMLDAAGALEDLRVPPGNRLEALKGQDKGKHSVRINDQWRIVFRWQNSNAFDVAVMDYHK